MGRELKRVPLDFSWPKGKVWEGYINPFRSSDCECCGGTGLNKATKEIDDDWYGNNKPYKWVYPEFDLTGKSISELKQMMQDAESGKLTWTRRYNDNAWGNHITDVEVAALLASNRLRDFTCVPLNDEQRKEKEKMYAENGPLFNNGYIPTADEVNEWNRSGTGFGHDAINKWICVEARAKHLGVYGKCEVCGGSGVVFESEEIKKQHEEWKKFEPPVGEGYQLWGTTSEGEPRSPVFKTLDELCEWCEKNDTTFAKNKATKEEWKKMLDDNMVFHQDGNCIFI